MTTIRNELLDAVSDLVEDEVMTPVNQTFFNAVLGVVDSHYPGALDRDADDGSGQMMGMAITALAATLNGDEPSDPVH